MVQKWRWPWPYQGDFHLFSGTVLIFFFLQELFVFLMYFGEWFFFFSRKFKFFKNCPILFLFFIGRASKQQLSDAREWESAHHQYQQQSSRRVHLQSCQHCRRSLLHWFAESFPWVFLLHGGVRRWVSEPVWDVERVVRESWHVFRVFYSGCFAYFHSLSTSLAGSETCRLTPVLYVTHFVKVPYTPPPHPLHNAFVQVPFLKILHS
jgi:hypothetical protein